MPDPKRVYTDDEVHAILSLAIDRQRAATPEGLSHDDLLAVARDAGIPPDAIDAAALELAGRRVAEEDARASHRRNVAGFRAHLFTYLAVNTFLLAVNFLTSTAYLWFIWPALAWGLGLVLHMRAALFPTVGELARAAERRAARRRRQEERRRRHEAKSAMRDGARDLGMAVERGVATILSATARKIHEEVERTPSALAPADARPVRVAAPPRGRRVDDAAEAEVDDELEDAVEPKAGRTLTK